MMRKNGRDLNDRKLNLWRLYAAFAICVLLIVAMTFMPFTPEQFVSIRCPELRVEEVVHVDEIMHNTYAVFFFDYMGFFNCVIVARDGPKQYLLTRAMHLSLITNELSNHITFERFGFEFWIDYGTLWLPDEDEIQSVTIDGMPMELINDEYIKICFRNSDGEQDVGYIEPRPGGIATMLEPWVDKQEHYADYNSNGYSLVSAETEVIGGRTYAIFTVKHTVDYLDRYGTTKGYLFDGDQIATDESTTGQSNWGYMLFEKVKREGETSWSNLTPSGYGFVNLGLSIGSEPSTRPIW